MEMAKIHPRLDLRMDCGLSLGFGVSGFGFRVSSFGFSGFGFSGAGSRVSGFRSFGRGFGLRLWVQR